MSFSLKNAGATDHRLVNKDSNIKLGRRIKVYIDDVLVKSINDNDHIQDLPKTSNVLRQYQI